MKTSVYLDYQATTPLDKEVLNIINETLREAWGNPSSSYDSGKQAKLAIEKARYWTAAMIKANSEDVIFTSGGTEANNMVLHTGLKHFENNCPKTYNNSAKHKPHFVTSNIEHDSVCKVLEHFEEVGLAEVTYVPVSRLTGRVEVEDILAAIRPNTCMVTIMLANNETGILQPVSEICGAVRSLKRNGKAELDRILLHTDAAQGIGKVPIDVSSLGVDYLTIVGHKFYAPRIGAVYINVSEHPAPVYPMLYGGGQERDIRPGTENTGMIAGLGKAAELVCKNLSMYIKHMKEIKDYLEQKLKDTFKEGVVFNGNFEKSEKLPNVCNVSFVSSGMLGHEILTRCQHLQASVGAACHSEQCHKPSAILLAIGVPEEIASSALRLSVGRDTTKEDIDVVIKDLVQATGYLDAC